MSEQRSCGVVTYVEVITGCCLKRMSKTRSFNEPVPEREKQPSRVKLGVVARLRREVVAAGSNKELATMVADFARITNRSTGRTVSKVSTDKGPGQNY